MFIYCRWGVMEGKEKQTEGFVEAANICLPAAALDI